MHGGKADPAKYRDRCDLANPKAGRAFDERPQEEASAESFSARILCWLLPDIDALGDLPKQKAGEYNEADQPSKPKAFTDRECAKSGIEEYRCSVDRNDEGDESTGDGGSQRTVPHRHHDEDGEDGRRPKEV